MMNFRPYLEGKKALVTGSTSGIGLAIAERFLENGIDVILHGSRDTGNELATELSAKHGANATYLRADLTKQDDILAMQPIVKDVDILVHNAGMQHVARFDQFPVDKLLAMANVHIIAPQLITQYALPHMIEQQWGRIIIMGSAHSFTASGGKAPYVTAKHALHGFSKGLTVDFAQYGITSNEIRPGYVDTPLVHKQIQDRAANANISYQEAEKALLSVHETGKFVDINEISNAALYLCSPMANSMTGNAVTFDGGWLSGNKGKQPQ